MTDLDTLRERVRRFTDSDRGKVLLRWLRYLVVGGVIMYLIYQLTQIGWGELWRSLPTTPYFYLTILVIYCTLPVAETAIYGRLWEMPKLDILSLMMRKRVLNADVVGYSGEFFLLAHARKRLSRPTRQIAGEIKDNLILSSVASITVAALILVSFLSFGWVALEELIGNATPGYIALGGLAFIMIIGLFVRFRKTLFTLGAGTLGYVLSIHFARFVVTSVVQVIQWWVVVPDAPFQAWATLLVILVALNRIPFIPSRDLVFAGVGIQASESLGVPVAVVAGMLLSRSVIDRVLNFALFTALSVKDGGEEIGVDDSSLTSMEEAADKEDATTEDALRSAGEVDPS
ncbi:hypothetical protein CRI94_14980 [Longibacter salinarum]|uniref:Flippase-like domain-containing protein n=1 Tax=Longibacter salinarum TaxID=1850348 RepID=A0A2A8CUZ3_9BACT|nr:hypothetical protein [Longibacter salinarum]PEN12323.1 hypothetical protein CRI94_14980 [Longibacter salinarum]